MSYEKATLSDTTDRGPMTLWRLAGVLAIIGGAALGAMFLLQVVEGKFLLGNNIPYLPTTGLAIAGGALALQGKRAKAPWLILTATVICWFYPLVGGFLYFPGPFQFLKPVPSIALSIAAVLAIIAFVKTPAQSASARRDADADPNQNAWLGCVSILVVLMGIGWLIFSVWNGRDDAPSTATYQAPAGSGTGPSDTSLASDASRYLRTNFSGDAAFSLVNSVEVKSGVLWIKTAIPAGDVASAVAVCGLGSSWAYGATAAVTAGIWGVSVRASDGQRLIQRDGIDDTCS